ncbi:uncharacterized protein LTR77_001810 [Saxophila tyrrhenica]|uniref:Uncharacterized protein n=1 Tax=Saxophila tyrrhenica TaxID=1690608 RepID=A0AAV9PNX6_9PEZI|nr:hypothetical protein LTR77_001810 [Saxophila tyrrhenica]
MPLEPGVARHPITTVRTPSTRRLIVSSLSVESFTSSSDAGTTSFTSLPDAGPSPQNVDGITLDDLKDWIVYLAEMVMSDGTVVSYGGVSTARFGSTQRLSVVAATCK